MRRSSRSPGLIGVWALVLASCGGGTGATTTTVSSTTTTAPPVVTTSTLPPTTTTTGTTLPPSPSLAVQGDKNEIVAALQFLINCSGSARLDVDGNFGPATRAALEQAQTRLGRPADGTLDEDTMAALARGCDQRRGLEDEGKTTIAGNAAPGDSEVFSVSLLTGSTVTAAFTRGGGLDLRLLGADGAEVPSQEPSRWEVDATQDYLLEVASPEEAVTFILVVEVAVATRPVGDWVLATDGLIYKGTKLALGSDAATVIGKVFDYLGHGVRGNLDEFDTDWYTITEPGDMGLRGIRIEGFALLFFGPDPNNPDRPETFRRHRFLGPTVDAAGNPRPRHYATTAEGITVGDTLADLKAVYGTRVTPGSNRDEHFYRLRGSPGVLCFYFDTDEAPADYSPITEIASECRSG